jgi:hypothetical protein
MFFWNIETLWREYKRVVVVTTYIELVGDFNGLTDIRVPSVCKGIRKNYFLHCTHV